jgi:hypothetical protein
MLPRIACLSFVCALLTVIDRPATAGGIHIRYGPDAPERMEAANVAYYEGVLHLEHNHPIAFALDHPFYTKMFDNPVMIDRLEMRWEAHEQRFEYWHDCLWKVLDGYRAEHHGLSSTSPIPPGIPRNLGEVGADSGTGSLLGGTDARGNNLGISPAGVPGGGVVALSVPEPSSGLLMLLGLAAAGAWVIARHRHSA